MTILSGPPGTSEYADFYGNYVGRVAHHPDAITALADERAAALALYRSIDESQSLLRYAPGKWSLREILGHLIDSERVFVFRALAFARGEEQALPGFDQDLYLRHAEFDQRPWASFVEEFDLLRRATIEFFTALPAAAWTRSGVAWNNRVSVRALAYITAGHEVHHRAIIEARYLGRELR